MTPIALATANGMISKVALTIAKIEKPSVVTEGETSSNPQENSMVSPDGTSTLPS